MIVLLVDDQVSILSGLISGIDWDALGINTVRTATNAPQAREILEKEPIDILLCDIEMPGENGLSLLRWARKQGLNFICIFLTCHADFLYTKEAIQLNCFDYILQPARYDDIQATISRAITHARDVRVEKNLEQYGMIAKNHTAGLFQSLFSDWSTGKGLSLLSLCGVLRQLGKNAQIADDCFVIWGHLLRWHTEPWPAQEWVYAVNNIIAELYETNGFSILPFVIDHTSLGWFVYMTGAHFTAPQKDNIIKPLHDASRVLEENFPFEFAFYVSPVISLEQLNIYSKILLQAKQDNVLYKKGIFSPIEQDQQASVVQSPTKDELFQWGSFIAKGNGSLAYEEISGFFDSAAKQGELNRKMLHEFWIQFQRVVLNTVWQQERDPQELFPILHRGENAQSLDEMKIAVKEITDSFVKQCDTKCSEEKITERIKKYVENNLDRALSVNDISEALFMNADYLSRLFKNETGTSLKEHIIHRKMETARVLLKTTVLPVSIIASKLGYDNFSYFSQAYRKVIGVSPTDERK